MYRKPDPTLTMIMVVLLAVGNAPLVIAGPSGSVFNSEQELLRAVNVTSQIDVLRDDFALDAEGLGLTVMEGVNAKATDERVVQIAFSAVGNVDMSTTGVLFQRREYMLTPVNDNGEIAATRTLRVAVDIEQELVFVTTEISFEKGIDAYRKAERFTGIGIDHVVQFPLDEYRKLAKKMANGASQEAVAQAFSKRMLSHPAVVSQTVVTDRDGQEVHVQGEMTVADAVALVSGGASDAVPGLTEKVSWTCVGDCFIDQGVVLSATYLICSAAVVAICAVSCIVIGPACLICFEAALLGCGIGTGALALGTLIGCMLLC